MKKKSLENQIKDILTKYMPTTYDKQVKIRIIVPKIMQLFKQEIDCIVEK